MPLRMSNYARDRFIAPEMSLFTRADIPDLGEKSQEQAQNQWAFIVNLSLRGGATIQGKQSFFNIIRRTNSAYLAYCRARELTLRYLEGPEGRELIYVEAIDEWEATLGYVWQALQLVAPGAEKVWFDRGDSGPVKRLNDLHNTAKHADGRIAARTLHAESPIGVWLTNAGLRSVETHLTFDELAEVLDVLWQYSDIVRDPASARDRLEHWIEGLAEETSDG